MFFTIFPGFFTGAKPFSRALFSRFSRLVQAFHGDFLGFFHGFDLRFHGRKTKIFHGRDIFFTGRISRNEIKKAKNYNFDTENTKNLCKKRYFLKKCRVFSRALFDFSRAQFFKYFTCTSFSFTGKNLFEIFTGTFALSRALFKSFSRGVPIFHGRKTKNFHGRKKIFHGEKKNTALAGIFVSYFYSN